jgi:hypothetical protein
LYKFAFGAVAVAVVRVDLPHREIGVVVQVVEGALAQEIFLPPLPWLLQYL